MIIAFSGRKFAGKDTCAEALIRRHKFKRVGLADKLKDICSIVCSLPREDMDDPSKKETIFETPFIIGSNHIKTLVDVLESDGFKVSDHSFKSMCKEFIGKNLTSIREVLQIFGTDICRNNVSDTIWLEYFQKTTKGTEGDIVVTDARFKNERDFLKSLGALLVLVKRENTSEAGKLNKTELHISENQLGDDMDYDVIVYNQGCVTGVQSEISMWYTIKSYAIKGNY